MVIVFGGLMPIKKGHKFGGVHTLNDLKERCIVDEFTDCWHFHDAGGNPVTNKTNMSIHYAPTNSKISAVRRAYMLANPDVNIPKNKGIFKVCNCFDCVNPDHLRMWDRKQYGVHQKKTGSQRTIAKINSARKAAKQKQTISDDVKRIIATSSESSRVLSDKYGVSQSHVRSIKRRWLVQQSPFAQLFNFTQKKAA